MGSDWDIPNILSMQSPLRNPCEPAHETGRVCFGQSSVTDRGLSSLEVCHVTDDYVHRRKSTCIDAYAVIGHFFSFPSFVSHPQDGNLSVTDWWVLHAFIVFFSLGDPPIQKILSWYDRGCFLGESGLWAVGVASLSWLPGYFLHCRSLLAHLKIFWPEWSQAGYKGGWWQKSLPSPEIFYCAVWHILIATVHIKLHTVSCQLHWYTVSLSAPDHLK